MFIRESEVQLTGILYYPYALSVNLQKCKGY